MKTIVKIGVDRSVLEKRLDNLEEWRTTSISNGNEWAANQAMKHWIVLWRRLSRL
jgi:hypothetical protein